MEIPLPYHEEFGNSMNMSSNGEFIAATFWRDFDFAQSVNIGKAMEFEFVDGNWTTVGNEISGVDEIRTSGFRYIENLASSISISVNGSVVAVGGDRSGHSFSDPEFKSYGLARVYNFQDGIYKYLDNWWHLQGRPIRGDGIDVGISAIDLNADGTVIYTGHEWSNKNGSLFDTGKVRIFKLIDLDWVRIGPSLSGMFGFGSKCAISADGEAFAGLGYLECIRIYNKIPAS